jgi:hypothetical protein
MQIIFARTTNRCGFDVDRDNACTACRSFLGSSSRAATGPDIDQRDAIQSGEWKAADVAHAHFGRTKCDHKRHKPTIPIQTSGTHY